jgi:parallel beta-helix repeat protein
VKDVKYKFLWVFILIVGLAAAAILVALQFSGCLLPNGRVGSATYYSAKNGNDANPGTKAAPFLSIKKAADIMVAGDTVIVSEGSYNAGKGGLAPANSGEAGSPITFKANGRVLIDGRGSNPAVDFRKRNYIVFDGFEVSHGISNISLENAKGVELKNSTFRDSDESSAINMFGSDSCRISRNKVLRAANCGILADGGAHDNLVEYNTVEDTVSNDGLSQGSTGHPAGNNNIWQYNVSTGSAEDGIDFYSGDHTIIRGNVLHDNHQKGIYLHGGSHCLIEKNLVYGNDWYGLYLGISNGKGAYNKFENNLFYDNHRVIIAAPNSTFINNTFVARESLGRELIQFYGAGTGVGTVFKNNIFYNGSQQIFKFFKSTKTDIASDYNLFYAPYPILASKVGVNYSDLATWQAATGYDAHSVFADPLFNDIQKRDFRLRSGSPAIDAGTSAGAPKTDIVGNARGGSFDIGAYEYQAPGAISSP